jgi:hypothetical protein
LQSDADKASRLEKINRNLMIGVIVLVIIVALLAIEDFA